MNNLKKELNEMLKIFDFFKISEEQQREIISHGVDFNYTFGDIDYDSRNRHFDCFKFSRFLIYCKKCGVPFDMNNFSSVKFEFFVHEFDKIDNKSIGIIKTKEINH